MKDNFNCGVASAIDNDCLSDVYKKSESKVIRNFPTDCNGCEGYGNCEYCCMENTSRCCECIYLAKNGAKE